MNQADSEAALLLGAINASWTTQTIAAAVDLRIQICWATHRRV
jgi:hypothetical protein